MTNQQLKKRVHRPDAGVRASAGARNDPALELAPEARPAIAAAGWEERTLAENPPAGAALGRKALQRLRDGAGHGGAC